MPQARLERVSHSLEQRPRVRALLTEESLKIDREKVRVEYLKTRRMVRPSNAPQPLLNISLGANPSMTRSRKQMHRRVMIDHSPLVKLQYNLLQGAGTPYLRSQLEDKFRDINKSIEQASRLLNQSADHQYQRAKLTEKEIDELYAEDKLPGRRKAKQKGETFRISRKRESRHSGNRD